MQSLHRGLLTCAAVATCVIAVGSSRQTASAHNLYVLVEKQPAGADKVDVIFEHSPYPGKGTYNEPLIKRGRTWVVSLDGKTLPLATVKETKRLGKKFLQTQTDSEGPRAVVHSCEWGVYKGRMDYFHGKYLDVENVEQLNRLSVTKELPLDIVAEIEDGALVLGVVKDGKPVAGGKIWVWTPNGKETRHVTDDEGRFRIEKPLQGTYSFAALHVAPKPTGEFQGEAFEGIMHGTTLSLRLPLAETK